MDDREKKENDVCPHCKKGKLEIINADEPYSDKHLMCNVCDSTYPINENIQKK